MSAYEGSKIQERDQDRKKDALSKLNNREPTKKELHQFDKLLDKVKPAIQAQKEKLELVYEKATHVDFYDFEIWMNERRYFIGKF